MEVERGAGAPRHRKRSGRGAQGRTRSEGLVTTQARMAVKLTINGQTVEAQPGLSLFDQAEAMGIDVPTSCRKQGKCKECMVEVVDGMAELSPMTEPERHLKGNFRLSCHALVPAESGHVRCHTMRRGQTRIERQALGLPGSDRALEL